MVQLFRKTKAVIFKLAKLRLKFNRMKYELVKLESVKNHINIIYLSHDGKDVRSGGDKVIYRHSEIINKLGQVGVSSCVLHAVDPSIEFDWFEHDVSFKKNHKFDPAVDFAVIPEIMVMPHAKMLSDIGVRYAIFVQGGYIMDGYSKNYNDLAIAYKNASLILAISDDTAECIVTAYPWVANKVIRIFYSVDANKFKSSQIKQNLITYMPRKLARHSNLIKFFLNDRLPINWQLKEIQGLNETGVVELLGKSKIFLSLSELEGCPLPPVEAALCGNLVIGYTGEGAKEYWKEPIFTEVYNGDIKKFVNDILIKIQQLNSNYVDENFDVARSELANRYSESAEKQSLLNFLSRVKEILHYKSTSV